MNMSFDFGTTTFVLNVADVLSGIAIVIAFMAYKATKRYSSVSAQAITYALNKEKLVKARDIIREHLKIQSGCFNAIKTVMLSLYQSEGESAIVHEVFHELNQVSAVLLDDGLSPKLKETIQREVEDFMSSSMIYNFVEANKEELKELYTLVKKH